MNLNQESLDAAFTAFLAENNPVRISIASAALSDMMHKMGVGPDDSVIVTRFQSEA